VVTLKRGIHKGTIHFLSLLSNDANNIYVQPGDAIYLQARPRTFVVIGATGQNGQFSFDTENLSMTEELSKAGGMLDRQSNPGAMFLHRLEDRDTLRELGVDVKAWPERQQKIPVVYHGNFNIGGEYLLATQVPVKDKDVIYVSNAVSVEIAKVLQFVRILGARGA